ncbi:MAG: protein kinase [Blastocatellia bacterium]
MIGSIVGNYKILDKIGEGGMGAVFKGVDLMLEREVAIKMLRPELASQPNVVERFRVEAVTLAKLNHSNVATLHSFFRQDEDFFMVMEFVRGETLDAVIKKQGAMKCEWAIELFCHALEGIDHAHQMGIVHRDIKPANMMLTETGSIKVMDFGIARVLGTDRMTKTGHLIGTVEYMSPEQVRGEETDARSDIYSLGILLYEMLTGRVPFSSTSEYELMRSQIEDAPPLPRSFAPHLTLAVEQSIMRALAKKREARYQSASEFRAMLMQKNTGAVSRPDTAASPASPASYVTRANDSLSAPVPAIPETRLAPDARSTPAASGGPVGQPNDPTVAPDAGVQPGYPQTASYSSAQPGAAGPPASLIGKLSWKHYTGAGAVLVVLITVPLVLLGGGGPATTTQPAVSQPAVSDPAPTTTPAQSVGPASNQPTILPPSSIPAQPSDAGGSASGSKTTSSTPSSDAGRAPSPREPQTAAERRSPGSRQERASTARRGEEKGKRSTKADKVGAAADAVGGVIKKFGGVFGKKKN